MASNLRAMNLVATLLIAKNSKLLVRTVAKDIVVPRGQFQHPVFDIWEIAVHES